MKSQSILNKINFIEKIDDINFLDIRSFETKKSYNPIQPFETKILQSRFSLNLENLLNIYFLLYFKSNLLHKILGIVLLQILGSIF